MNLPSLPTDNLYKFFSISGIVLFLIFHYYPKYLEKELSKESIQIEGEIDILYTDTLLINNKQKFLEKKLFTLQKECNCGLNFNISKDKVIWEILENSSEKKKLGSLIQSYIEEIDKLNFEHIKKQIEILSKQRKLLENKKEIEEYIKDSKFYLPFSFYLLIFGFVLWFFRTQNLQDKILYNQFKEVTDDKYCNSCGIYLKNIDIYKTLSKEEFRKLIYCNHCYSDGQFLEPELDYSMMKKKVKKRCNELGFNKIETFLYLLRLRDLTRWKNDFKW